VREIPTLKVIEANKFIKRVSLVIEGDPDISLTVPQLEVMQIISDFGGAIESMRSLTYELGVTPPVSTGLIDRLERDGLVIRSINEDDRRKIPIVLTKKGKDVLNLAQTAIAEMGP
jgi:DNA-binding MarR family transcriptional regulator